MKDCILFIHGTYRVKDIPFYRKLCRSKFKVAVNGGYSFFRKSGLVPDIVIGDMDSAFSPPAPSSKTALLTFPVRKDKTDSQLALEYCIGRRARSIDLVMPSVGQADHYVANLFLGMLQNVSLWVKGGGKFRVVNKSYEVHFLNGGSVTFVRCGGHTVSVIPMSRSIVLDCEGTEYDVSRARIARGQTRALRNQIVCDKAVFAVRGEALLWHFWG